MQAYTKSYWNGTGKYQTEYNDLKKLVPSEGEANTLHGELLRGAFRLYYDYYNNGNMNAQKVEEIVDEVECDYCCGDGTDDDGDACSECAGSGYTEESDEDIIVDYYYAEFLELIAKHIPSAKEVVKKIEGIIVNCYGASTKKLFSAENEKVYEDLVDAVIEHILNSENKPFGALKNK